MRLYQVYNGFHGSGWVSVLVVADSEARARTLASEQFRADEKAKVERLRSYSLSGTTTYVPDERYWSPENLEVHVLCDDLTVEWAGEVSE